MSKFIDLTGQRFNRWVALSYEGDARWLCKCDCGTIKKVHRSHLKSGKSKSCGCLSREIASNSICMRNKTHGLYESNLRLYNIWHSIKQRCYYDKNINYRNYGGRGITLCDEWLNNFKSFYDWAMKNGYDKNAPRGKCTIDRIDVNGNYEPNNCRWVTQKQQSRNKRTNRFITCNGETKTIADWCEEKGLCHTTICDRLKAGYSEEQAILMDIGFYKNNIFKKYIEKLEKLNNFIKSYYEKNDKPLKRIDICEALNYNKKSGLLDRHLQKLIEQGKIIKKDKAIYIC